MKYTNPTIEKGREIGLLMLRNAIVAHNKTIKTGVPTNEGIIQSSNFFEIAKQIENAQMFEGWFSIAQMHDWLSVAMEIANANKLNVKVQLNIIQQYNQIKLLKDVLEEKEVKRILGHISEEELKKAEKELKETVLKLKAFNITLELISEIFSIKEVETLKIDLTDIACYANEVNEIKILIVKDYIEDLSAFVEPLHNPIYFLTKKGG